MAIQLKLPMLRAHPQFLPPFTLDEETIAKERKRKRSFPRNL